MDIGLASCTQCNRDWQLTFRGIETSEGGEGWYVSSTHDCVSQKVLYIMPATHSVDRTELQFTLTHSVTVLELKLQLSYAELGGMLALECAARRRQPL